MFTTGFCGGGESKPAATSGQSDPFAAADPSLERITTAKLQEEFARLEDFAPNGRILPLDVSLRKQWKINGGGWSLTNGKLTGTGKGSIDFLTDLHPPVSSSFTMQVNKGMRPRVIFSGVKLANEGYARSFRLFPRGKVEFLVHAGYKRTQELATTLIVTKDAIFHLRAGEAIELLRKETTEIPSLRFSCGDGWSQGEVVM
jgi:hypothetical protein